MDFSFVDSLTESHIAAGDFPAAVVHIFDEDGVLYSSAYGDAADSDWFDMASVSKTVMLALMNALFEAGRLSPGHPALEVLPGGFGPVTAERLRGVNVFQLMSHTSLLLPWFPFYCDGRDFYTVLERALSASPPLPEPAYSDLNYMLLARIFTHASGLSLRDGLDTFIKKPLGIQNLSYGPVSPSLCAPSCYGNQIEKAMCAERGLSFGGWREDGAAVRGTCNDGNGFYYFGGASGHAGIFADAAAMTAFGRHLLRTWPESFVAALQTAAGVRGIAGVFPDGCGHDGFTGPSLWLSKSRHVGAVILSNRLCRNDGKPLLVHAHRRALHAALCARFPVN